MELDFGGCRLGEVIDGGGSKIRVAEVVEYTHVLSRVHLGHLSSGVLHHLIYLLLS